MTEFSHQQGPLADALQNLRDNPAVALPQGTILSITQDYYVLIQADDHLLIVKHLDALRCPTDEMLNAWLKASGEWVEPYESDPESGASDITPEWADELNAEQRGTLRRGWVAAVASLARHDGQDVSK